MADERLADRPADEPMAILRTTLDSEDAACTLSRRLVEERLACCVHRWRIDSVYEWQGAVQEDGEWLVEARTPPARAQALWRRLEELHPYDTPLVERLDDTRVHAGYGRWAAEVTSPR